MRLRSLIHLAKITQAISAKDRVVVVGSSSLLCFHPDLGDAGQPLETSLDADFFVEDCDEDLARVLGDAIGETSLFEKRVGYYADFLRPEITSQLPKGWEERLAPLPECAGAFCIEPHDLAVAKLQAGRPKDLQLLVTLLRRELLDGATLRTRLEDTRLQEKMIILAHRRLREVIDAARPAGGSA